MRTKKQIKQFIEDLAIGVQGKVEHYEERISLYEEKLIGIDNIMQEVHIKSIKTDMELALEYTKGQLYELNYILENLNRDKRKKDQ